VRSFVALRRSGAEFESCAAVCGCSAALSPVRGLRTAIPPVIRSRSNNPIVGLDVAAVVAVRTVRTETSAASDRADVESNCLAMTRPAREETLKPSGAPRFSPEKHLRRGSARVEALNASVCCRGGPDFPRGKMRFAFGVLFLPSIVRAGTRDERGGPWFLSAGNTISRETSLLGAQGRCSGHRLLAHGR